MTTTKKNLYALIVAIDDYQVSVPIKNTCKFGPLKGCVNDANSIIQYLEQEDDFNLQLVFLKNKDATKQAVADHFLSHLSKAGSDDVALFYYSGHGIQEMADGELWKEETDGKLESLVCYNEVNKPCLLADKELRFLIHRVATGTEEKPKEKPPHILTIFDCCHSGENTRNGFFSSNETLERRVNCLIPQRAWNEYIFRDDILENDIKSQPLSEALPEGIHLHLSACESDESALEVGGKGVFTSYLTNVLRRANGNITYYDLMSQVRHYLKNTFAQKPQLSLTGESSDAYYTTFLNKSVSTKPLYANVIYNHTNGWIMDMGSLTGISQKIRRVNISGPKGESFTGKVIRIQPDATWLKFGGANLPDKRQVYKAEVKGIMAYRIKLFINNHDAPSSATKALLDDLQQRSQNVVLVELESEADYSLQIRNNSYYITNPFEIFKPRTRPVSFDLQDASDSILNYIHHISQWEFVHRLNNAHTYLFEGDPIKIEAFEGGQTGTAFPIGSKVLDLHPEKRADGSWKGKIALKLTNTTSRKLYVSTLYLPSEFRVFLKGTDPVVYTLQPNEHAWLFNWRKGEMSYTLEDKVLDYNWKFSEDILKLIVSTTPFDVGRLEKKGLPQSYTLADIRGGKRGALDLEEDGDPQELEGDDWTTQKIQLRFNNPLYNQLEESRISQMIAAEELSDFTLGVFFEYNSNFDLELKEDMSLNGSIKQLKKLVNDKNEDRVIHHFNTKRGLFPDLKSVIVVGDHWINKQNIQNIYSHLSRHYNILPINSTFVNSENIEQFITSTDAKKVIISPASDDLIKRSTAPFLEKLKAFCKNNSAVSVITHGFDYGISNNPDQAEKTSQVDELNEKLAKLATDTPNLIYLDLRNCLSSEQWSENGLPNEDGFEKLAGYFLSALKQE